MALAECLLNRCGCLLLVIIIVQSLIHEYTTDTEGRR